MDSCTAQVPYTGKSREGKEKKKKKALTPDLYSAFMQPPKTQHSQEQYNWVQESRLAENPL